MYHRYSDDDKIQSEREGFEQREGIEGRDIDERQKMIVIHQEI